MPDPAHILGLEEIRFIEPSFAALPDDRFTTLIQELDGDQARLLVDENSDPVCMAVHTGERGWVAGCFHLRRPTAGLISRFEDLGGEIYQEERRIWSAAVRGQFSREMASGTTPSLEDLNPSRRELVASLLSEVWGRGEGRSCIDCGCGSGVGSLVLRTMGFAPLSCDNDASLLALGLARQRLLPEETMLIDASLLAHYTGDCDTGLGLMFGEIHEFNAGMWEAITRELVMLTAQCLITVGTSQEAERIRGWVSPSGRQVEIFENMRDPIYDRWVCSIVS